MKKLVLAVATGFGLGFSPVASGTAGALLGLVLVVVLAPLPHYGQVAAAVMAALVAIPICGRAEAHWGTKDDGRIVADEYLTFPLCVLWLPWPEHLWLLPLAFVTNRVLDVLKPPPAQQAQALPGGWGIVLDDVCSSLYALGINHAIFWAVRAATSQE